MPLVSVTFRLGNRAFRQRRSHACLDHACDRCSIVRSIHEVFWISCNFTIDLKIQERPSKALTGDFFC